MIAALGSPVAQRLIDLLNTQGPNGLVVPPLVNHTQPTYVADTDYTETIDGVLVTYLTTTAIAAAILYDRYSLGTGGSQPSIISSGSTACRRRFPTTGGTGCIQPLTKTSFLNQLILDLAVDNLI